MGRFRDSLGCVHVCARSWKSASFVERWKYVKSERE
jgi:hypothetical protein